ncbi:MAG: AmmeMemoRadiSam system radical SAM enzyme [Bacteroidales bacterium]|nr:AmmeMemoRadiSam system radical SAM enzyme [Bacteroidales bacterium]
MYKKAKYYINKPNGLECQICPARCLLKEGKLSKCKTRIVLNGDLIDLSYSHACAINIDPVEKKPFFHFKPGMQTFSFGTAGCTFSCLNCQNYEISQFSPQDIKSYELSPQELVDSALEHKCTAVAYTYNEPTVYFEYMLDTARLAKQAGLSNLMVSNGYINEKPLMDLLPYLDAANIDLKVFDNSIYKKLTGGSLEPVLETLLRLQKNNIWIEITTLIIPQWTDDLKLIDKMCKWLKENGFEDYSLHFSRFHPSNKLLHIKPTPLRTLISAREIARKHGINYVYTGNAPEADGENTYCPNCHKLLVQRMGYNIRANYIEKNKCPECQTIIPGVWS